MAIFNGSAEDIQSKQNMLSNLEAEEGADKYPSVLGTKMYVADKIQVEREYNQQALDGKENISNRLDDLTSEEGVDKYPSVLGVKRYVSARIEEAGGSAQVDTDLFANALKGNAIGEIIRIDDVSPIEHNLKVNAIGANSITRRGKNLIAYPYNFNKNIQVVDGVKTQTINGITVVENEDRTLIFNGTATDKATFYLYGWYGGETEPLIPITNTFSISGNQKTDGCKVEVNTCTFNEASGKYDAMCWHTCRDNELTLSFDKKHLLKSAYISIEAGTTVNNYTVRPQIEIGGVSKYEPYIEPVTYPVNADGTVDGVKSVYPTTVLMADAEGAIIELEYNKDTNAVLGGVETALDNIIAIQESLIGGDGV